jgi:hypothetical protein
MRQVRGRADDRGLARRSAPAHRRLAVESLVLAIGAYQATMATATGTMRVVLELLLPG